MVSVYIMLLCKQGFMKKIYLFIAISIIATNLYAQELYVFTEPASNMPTRSIGAKATAKFLRERSSGKLRSRYTPELMYGANRNLMLHVAGSFSDMYSNGQQWESVRFYGKYRFLSSDEMYRHFRMAVFVEASYSRNQPYYGELSLEGDQGGVQIGAIATQLLHKLAISSTVSYLQTAKRDASDPLAGAIPAKAFNYSVSAGYLVLPKKYTDYKQVNLNLYLEVLGQQTTDINRYYVDLAPAVQLIFNSQAKLNLGYRFQLGSDMNRMASKSWLLGFEWLFLR
jgi:hypothetical protein